MGCGGSKPEADWDKDFDSPGSPAKAQEQKGPRVGVCSFESQYITRFPKVPTDVPADCKELNIADNELLSALDGVGALTELEKLDANSCALTKVPDEIEGCKSLKELLLYKNKLKELSPKLGVLAALETLNIFNNQVKKLPPELGQLTNLEEVNAAANKLMMLTDAHFTGWASVKVLSLYDNNLVRMGSLAPLVALEELRLYGNNLEAMPTLSSHPALTTYEIYKNRITAIDPDYFGATPNLQRLSIQGNGLEALPPSLQKCSKLVGVQAQENKLKAVPGGAWPATLETLFVQDNSGEAFSLPAELKKCKKLKRINLSRLKLDEASASTAEAIKLMVLKQPEGMFWGVDGKKQAAAKK